MSFQNQRPILLPLEVTPQMCNLNGFLQLGPARALGLDSGQMYKEPSQVLYSSHIGLEETLELIYI